MLRSCVPPYNTVSIVSGALPPSRSAGIPSNAASTTRKMADQFWTGSLGSLKSALISSISRG
ncbi:hypothetical protein GN244_ATG12344 [Phytophthora infestans]|uniref:Uncharacterized protein n=1 Tax=Phytophthora infestans TaxID=4787 RepID=A0A833WB69_PHYIN|nr:hypothetical protein GN244_ATG12344 [Phytophthora infestans]